MSRRSGSRDSEVLPTFYSILRDDLRACPEGRRILAYPTIADAYHGMQESAEERWLITWLVQTFVTDAGHRQRILRMIGEPRRFFRDLAVLAAAVDGSPRPVPACLIEALERRLLLAAYPYTDEIVREARQAPASRARDNLLAYIQEPRQWRMRSD